MKSLMKMAIATAAMAGAAMLGSAPANAQVHIGIGLPGVHVGVGVGAPGPGPGFFYGQGYYPPGPCDSYNYYYQGDCGYSVYNGPIDLGGVNIGGPHYYRWSNGQPYFWYRGGWQIWNGWNRVNFGWNHGEGWGWHGGRWDRGWGNAHWHGGGPGRGPGPGDHRGGGPGPGNRDHHDNRDDHNRP